MHNDAKRTHLTAFFGVMVTLLYMLFYCYDYLLQTSFSVLPNSFFVQHHITPHAFGFLSAAFFYGYAIFQIPLGFCLDRIGLKYTSILCTGLCGLGTVLFYFSNSFTLFFMARFLMGAGTACACVMSIYAVSTWLMPKYFTIGVGMVQVSACLGSIFGQAIGSWLMHRFGLEATIQVVIYFVVGLFTIYLFLPKYPPNHKPRHKAEKVKMKELPRLLLNRQIMTVAALGFISWVPVSVLAASWMVRLLDHDLGWPQHQSARLLIGFWIGLAVASLVIGKLSDKMKSRQKIVIIAFMIQFICGGVLAYTTSMTSTLLIVLLFLLGAAASVQTFSFILIVESVPKRIYGTAASLVNMVAATSGGIMNPIFGLIATHAHTYYTALWLFPGLSVIGIFLAAFVLRETYIDDDTIRVNDVAEVA